MSFGLIDNTQNQAYIQKRSTFNNSHKEAVMGTYLHDFSYIFALCEFLVILAGMSIGQTIINNAITREPHEGRAKKIEDNFVSGVLVIFFFSVALVIIGLAMMVVSIFQPPFIGDFTPETLLRITNLMCYGIISIVAIAVCFGIGGETQSYGSKKKLAPPTRRGAPPY